MTVSLEQSFDNIIGSRGLYAFRTDQENQDDLTVIGYTNSSEARVAIQKTNGAEVALDEGGSSQGYATIGTTILWEPTYYYIGGALRVTDGKFGTNNQTKWIGYINRTIFPGTNFATTLNGWYSKDNDLPAPTVGANSATPPTEGAGFNVSIATPGGGTWEAGTYELASTFIYDWTQESDLYVWGDTVSVAANDQLDCDVYYNEPYNERITGGRIYIREDGTSDSWTLLVDIDFQQGVRSELTEQFTDWQNGNEQSDTVTALSQSAGTYETLNGYSPFDVQAVAIGDTGQGYKCATVASRRAFVGNVKATNEDDESVWMPDRVYYSGVNQFDKFPTINYITILENDGEDITALAHFADRLLVFKSSTLVIVNIAHPDPTEWFQESVHRYKGVGMWAQVKETEYGVAWVNRFGAFFYDGNAPMNLTAQYSDPSRPLVARAPSRGPGDPDDPEAF